MIGECQPKHFTLPFVGVKLVGKFLLSKDIYLGSSIY